MPDKKAILARLHQKAAAGVPIIGTGAGTGLTAKAEAEGDTDLIIAYATGSFRMAGRSSLEGRFAASDANAAVLHMMDELIPVAGDTPVLGGVFVQDPFSNKERLLAELAKRGCAGVQNIPGMGGQAIMEGEEVVRSSTPSARDSMWRLISSAWRTGSASSQRPTARSHSTSKKWRERARTCSCCIWG